MIKNQLLIYFKKTGDSQQGTFEKLSFEPYF